MIITSNSVIHEYTVPSLTYVGEVDGLLEVACKATVYLNSSITFPHTYEIFVGDDPGFVGFTTSVTENKTITHFTYYDVELNTVGISSSSFVAWEDLEENQVLQWCFDIDENTMIIRQNNETLLLEEKDKLLNPLKYHRNTPPTPWRVREDQKETI